MVADEFETVNTLIKAELPLFFDISQGHVSRCQAKLAEFQRSIYGRWSAVFEGLAFDDGQDFVAEGYKAQKMLLEALAHLPRQDPGSPTDVPTASICSSPKEKANPPIVYPVRMPGAKSIEALSQAFETMHRIHSPSDSDSEQEIAENNQQETEVPPLPSGQSRVAALAAQLEASKIIFRPMAPVQRPKPERDYELEETEEEEYQRHLGKSNPYPVPKTKPETKKKERAPKPPKREYVKALFDFEGKEKGDLAFRRGDKIEVLIKTEQTIDWWTGRLNQKIGVFPANYVIPFI